MVHPEFYRKLTAIVYPCAIAAVLETANFLKINVDIGEHLTCKYNITSLPTFVFLNNGNLYHKIDGTNMILIDEILNNFNLS